MNLGLLAFAFILFLSCQTENNYSPTSSTVDTSQKAEATQQKAITGFYKWSGSLNSSIPIFMWFVVWDSVIKGELTYLQTKKQLPITILGTINDEGFKIHEFQKDGIITGTLIGKQDGNEFNGSWYHPSSGKELPFQFGSRDTIINSVDTILQPINIHGNYSYQFGKEGNQGGIEIRQINRDIVSINISCVTGPPAFNVANVVADSVQVSNNTITYKTPGTEKCQFRINIYKDFLIINYVDKQYDCGFGLNADVEGIFIKKSVSK